MQPFLQRNFEYYSNEVQVKSDMRWQNLTRITAELRAYCIEKVFVCFLFFLFTIYFHFAFISFYFSSLFFFSFFWNRTEAPHILPIEFPIIINTRYVSHNRASVFSIEACIHKHVPCYIWISIFFGRQLPLCSFSHSWLVWELDGDKRWEVGIS